MTKITKSFFVLAMALMVLPLISSAQNKKASVKDALQKLQSVEKPFNAVPTDLLTTEEKSLLREYNAPHSAPPAIMANGDVYVMDVFNLIYGTFPLTGPFNINQTGPGTNVFADDYDVTGTLYGLDFDANSLVTIDQATGVTTPVGPLTGMVGGDTPTGLAWNALTATMYASSTNGTTTTLYTINLGTGELTPIGATGNALGIWLAIDNAGICYMADIGTDSLYTIDLATATATMVGPLGVDLNFAQDADVDTATNTLYMAGYLLSGGSNIYSIDVATGAATNLGPVTNGGELGGFSIQGPPVNVENFGCADALPIGLGITNADGPSNTEGGASNICLTGATDAVWYKYTASNSGDLTITSDLASNTGVDTRVSVYNNDCNALVCIASDDNSGANNTSEVVISVESGTTYLIEWDDANDDSAFDFELLLDIACPDPLNFVVSDFDDTTATFTWDAVPEATNGYILSVFEDGADPQTATPVYTENVPAGTTTATATGLVGSTMYDAYLTADCDTEGFSNDLMINLETAVAPPVCGGKFYDTGGPSGQYENSESYSVLIEPGDPNNLITLDFLMVDIESGFDQLHIYDGDDASANELSDPVNGVQSPGSYTSNIPGGNLFVTFTSDTSVQRDGWEADVICEPAPACQAPFNFEVTAVTETTATFTWEAIANATNGYIFSVFNAGDDPTTDTPVYTENIPAGTTTATATGLNGDTTYDAYVVSDCDVDGVSTMTMTTFITNIPDPVCGGILVDSGGISGDYQNNENTTVVVTPDLSGEAVTATFTFFDVEASWDALYVYDGPDTSSPLIDSGNPATNSGFPAGGYYGTTIPGPFTSTHPSGTLTFVFMSDSSVPKAGYVADITCALTPPPNDLIVNSIDVDEVGFPYTDPEVRTSAATTENGNPNDCDITGANGVWYNFVAEGDGTAVATITSPAGASSVTFYTAPNESASETDLTLVDQNSNQCLPGTSSSIFTLAGQAYYVFVMNTGGSTDIVIDGTNLGVSNNTIQGFSYYPNPASGIVNLKSVDNIETVSIFNILGQKVMDQNVEATTSQLDLSQFNTGTYIMKVSVKGQIGTYKIIKE